MARDPFDALERQIVRCTLCPRLVEYRQKVAITKRRAYRDQEYWGRPVPGFGDPEGRLLIIGLAPGAHGANRTGRMFTGDRSGDFLYRALYETGFANQATSISRDDGLKLIDCWITAAARCVPPDNKPLPVEIANCSAYLEQELTLFRRVQAVVVLGRIAFETYRAIRRLPRLEFAHGKVHTLDPVLIASYHPSQQNTQTGKLTAAMLRDVFVHARTIIEQNAVSGASSAARLG